SSTAIYSIKRSLSYMVSDRAFARMYHRLHLGNWPNLDKPETFNEKLQWLKLYYRPPELPALVDKWQVRSYVEQKLGGEFLVPVHGVFDSADAIDFELLPPAFVLKPTHGSGWVIVCTNKRDLDEVAARRKLKTWLGRNYYYHAREWAYRTLRPMIVCEKLLLDESGRIPMDYKLFCFGGK